MKNFIVELDNFEPFTMSNNGFTQHCFACDTKYSIIPYYMNGNLDTGIHSFYGTCSKCGCKGIYSSKKQFRAVYDYVYKTRTNIKEEDKMDSVKKNYNSDVYQGSLTIGRRNKKLLEQIKYVSGSLNIHEKITELPKNLEVASNLTIQTVCPDLELKNLKIKGYIKFVACDIKNIHPSAQAKEYRIENMWNNSVLTFTSVYEIYEAFPHLVPDEFQDEYGFEHITIKDRMRIAPIVLGSIDSHTAQKCMKAKYIVVYSAEKQVLDIMKGNDYGNELYSEIFDVLPDIEY